MNWWFFNNGDNRYRIPFQNPKILRNLAEYCFVSFSFINMGWPSFFYKRLSSLFYGPSYFLRRVLLLSSIDSSTFCYDGFLLFSSTDSFSILSIWVHILSFFNMGSVWIWLLSYIDSVFFLLYWVVLFLLWILLIFIYELSLFFCLLWNRLSSSMSSSYFLQRVLLSSKDWSSFFCEYDLLLLWVLLIFINGFFFDIGSTHFFLLWYLLSFFNIGSSSFLYKRDSA